MVVGASLVRRSPSVFGLCCSTHARSSHLPLAARRSAVVCFSFLSGRYLHWRPSVQATSNWLPLEAQAPEPGDAGRELALARSNGFLQLLASLGQAAAELRRSQAGCADLAADMRDPARVPAVMCWGCPATERTAGVDRVAASFVRGCPASTIRSFRRLVAWMTSGRACLYGAVQAAGSALSQPWLQPSTQGGKPQPCAARSCGRSESRCSIADWCLSRNFCGAA